MLLNQLGEVGKEREQPVIWRPAKQIHRSMFKEVNPAMAHESAGPTALQRSKDPSRTLKETRPTFGKVGAALPYSGLLFSEFVSIPFRAPNFDQG